MSEINVTPFVDVMLVLLIVFMVTAPLLTVGVQVDLPKSEAPNIQGSDEPLTVTIDSAGLIYIQETEVPESELAVRLKAIAGEAPDRRIFVRGDQAIGVSVEESAYSLLDASVRPFFSSAVSLDRKT